MEKLIALLFLSRDQMHKFHLAEVKYGRHEALRTYYEDIVDAADELAEVWQGKYDKVLVVPKMNSEAKSTPLETLRVHAEWIEKHRYTECNKDDAAIQALVDEVLHLIYSTCYKLKRLE